MFVSRKVRHYSLTTREWKISEHQKESSSTKFEIIITLFDTICHTGIISRNQKQTKVYSRPTGIQCILTDQ